jgi:hypothetical protein
MPPKMSLKVKIYLTKNRGYSIIDLFGSPVGYLLTFG